MFYTKIGILDFDEFCELSTEGEIILIESDAGFEEVMDEKDVLTVKITVLEFLVHAIIPEKSLIVYYAYPIDIPPDLSPDSEALVRFERTERQNLIEKLKEKIGPEKKYVAGVLLPPEVEVQADYGTLSTIVNVLRDSGFLDDSTFDEPSESEVKICPACNSELHMKVKNCLVCGYSFESQNFR